MAKFEDWFKKLNRPSLGSPASPRSLSLAEALPALVPKVRPRFHYENRVLGQALVCPVFRPLAELFAVSLAVDFPEGELDLGLPHLEAWGADFDLLLQRSRSNLLLRGGQECFHALRPGLFRSTWEDELDGSRVLLPGVLKGLRLQGDPVVVLPNRSTLLVAGSEDARSLVWILEAALEFLREDPHSLNGCPLRLKGFQWELWQPAPDHPAAPLLARVRRSRMLEEYSRQKAMLDRIHGRAGRSVAVAPLLLEKSASGTVTSRTFWAQGVEEGWLPEADLVGLMDPAAGPDLGSGPCRWVPWAQVRSQLGHLLEPMGLFPERYRFRHFPDAGLLERMVQVTG